MVFTQAGSCASHVVRFSVNKSRFCKEDNGTGLNTVAESLNTLSATTDSMKPASSNAWPIAVACTLKKTTHNQVTILIRISTIKVAMLLDRVCTVLPLYSELSSNSLIHLLENNCDSFSVEFYEFATEWLD